MPVHRLRRTLGLLTASAVLATMTTATVAAPAVAAKPKCQGFKATIVGTKKNDVIRGTARRDIIVAKGGADRIYGKGGNDVICAGGGNDVVFGGPGADTLWGQLGNDILNGNAGNDFLAGQVGNDTLNGGINSDTCYQGTGSGPVLNCERPTPPVAAPAPAPAPAPAAAAPAPPPPSADLMVSVPVEPKGAIYQREFSIMVTVKNNGPAATPYLLGWALDTDDGTCSEVKTHDGLMSSLDPSTIHQFLFTFSCLGEPIAPGGQGSAIFTATVSVVGPPTSDDGTVDPDTSNNVGTQTIVLIQQPA